MALTSASCLPGMLPPRHLNSCGINARCRRAGPRGLPTRAAGPQWASCERNGTNGGRLQLRRMLRRGVRVGAPLRNVGGAVTERAADGADGAPARVASLLKGGESAETLSSAWFHPPGRTALAFAAARIHREAGHVFVLR